MDFFAPDSSRMQVSAAPTDVSDPFAEAIGRRFSGAAAPMLTAKLVLDKSPLDNALYAPTPGSSTRPESVVPSLSMARSGSSQATATFSNMSLDAPGRPPVAKQMSLSLSAQPADVSRYTSVTPKDLATFLALSPQPLVLDVRSTNAHALSHIRGAISLSVPSTLLKRPNFSLINLSTMVASPSAQAAFSQWPTAARILVYDADLPKLADGCGVLGLLRKFDAAGFKGELAWVVGGHNAVARLARDCLEASSTPTESEDRPSSNGGFVHAHNLPQSAFQQTGSTTGFGHKPNKLQASNPFYDNIRQNRELSHGITERIPLALPQEVLSRKDEIPVSWVRDIVENSEKEKGIEALAMQFYRVELGEQRRLQGVMSHHSQESNVHPNNDQKKLDSHSNPDTNRDAFPFSITAGVEKGAKNRYKNIWPYEHARVRLQTATDDGSDYVNASYVRPRGTNLQYIATQGPMPATFTDFWTMVWEQNVHVIVMLTRQVEGNQLKCGDYWSGGEYGPLRLQLIATEGGKEEVEQATGFDFGFGNKKPDEDSQVTIRRTFALYHTEHPDEPPRKVVQFQFLPWLDMNVPETPTGLLALVKSVREAAEEADKYKEQKRPSPVLVHCSAGVGRTGSFVAIDAILDGVRRDLEAKRPPLVETTSSDSTSESDPETSGEPSSDSLPSAKIRRGSLPESDMAAYRRPVNGAGLHMTPARQRQISLRKTLGARRSTSNVPITRLPEAENGRRITHSDAGRKHLAGATAGPASAETTNATSSLYSSDSSVSFNFSASSLPVSSLSSQNQGVSKPPVAPSLQATKDWSSDVANSVSKSDLVAPQPVHASSSKIGTPRPDSEMRDRDRDTFDYVLPRSLNRDKPASPLGSMNEPIREVLEDMREQRMSLCQSLRQYVFVHRAVVEGVLAMVDEEKERTKGEQVGLGAKRHASPTELIKVDMAGDTARVKKRTSGLSKDAMVVDS